MAPPREVCLGIIPQVELTDYPPFPVFNCQIEATPLLNESISVVFAWHSIEHLPQPRQAIDHIYRLLSPGGVFFGAVPNINSLCSEELLEKWEWLAPDGHYVHYSPQTMRMVLNNAGFLVESITTRSGGNYPHVSDVLENKFHVASEIEIAEYVKWLSTKSKGEEIVFIARKL